MTKKPLKCWALSDGRAGMAHQALGLAGAIAAPGDVDVTVKTAALTGWVAGLTERLLVAPGVSPLNHLRADSDDLTSDWPDILVACGRHAAGLSVAIKRAAAKDGHLVFTVQTQYPRVSPTLFDVVVPPAHDDLHGPNVLPSLGAIHHVTAEKLAQGAADWNATFAQLPRPLVAVLIGGTSHAYTLSEDVSEAIAKRLKALQHKTGCGYAVTTSRRTGAENERQLRAGLIGEGTWIWDGEGRNPYLGMLALADHFIVTADSANMATEAAATGKPIHVLDLPGGNAKFRRFHQGLRARGMARVLGDDLPCWSYPPLEEAARIGLEIRRRLGLEPTKDDGEADAAE